MRPHQAALCSLVLALLPLMGVAQDEDGPLRLSIETVEVTSEDRDEVLPAPLIEDRVLLLPVRLVLERLGAKLSWDDEEHTLTVALPDTEITLSPREEHVTLNGEDWEMGSPPPIKGGTMYLPRGVWERVLPLDIRHDERARTVEVRYRWEPRVVSVQQLAEFAEFHHAREVVLEGEYRGWRAKGLRGPVTAGPPERHRGDWILAEGPLGIYVHGHEPEGQDAAADPPVSVRVRGRAGITSAGTPYLDAESTTLP
jgi:hypothetical protein